MRSRRSFFRNWKAGESLELPLELPEVAAVTSSARPAPDSPATPLNRTTNRPSTLWLAAQFADFVREAHQAETLVPELAAIIAEERGQSVVVAPDEMALSAGITVGMRLPAALALAPSLHLQPLQPALLERALQALAVLAERYTSQVVLLPPNGLLLEIGASLRLFGDPATLSRTFVAACANRGFTAQYALATTPQAAEWLARCRPGSAAFSSAEIEQQLRDIPLSALGWPADSLRQFQSMGVRTLAECRRLPRAGFARRFGPARLLLLDRAYGVMPDPRTAFRAPEQFAAELELSDEIDRVDLLCEGAAILVGRLSLFLRHRQWCAREIELRFFPLTGSATSLTIRPAEAGQSSAHWLDLIRIRLERWQLPAPVILLGLYSTQFEAAVDEVSRLRFTPGPEPVRLGSAYSALIERLQARLGDKAVRHLRALADARPEFAVQSYPLKDSTPLLAAATRSPWQELCCYTGAAQSPAILQLARPLWLLAEPQAFTELPAQLGKICLQSEAERIESGWWDGRDMARDYYHATTASGARVWVFRERLSRHPAWYLQGYFG